MELLRLFQGAVVLAAMSAAFLPGCGRTGADLSLDADVARQSLVTTLDAWQAGKTPADLRSRSPQIIVGDFEWAAGAKLVSYTLVGDEFDDGANLHTTAELTLEGATSGQPQQRVTYIIGTEPQITVFRAEEPAM